MATRLLNGQEPLKDGNYNVVDGNLCLNSDCSLKEKIDVEGSVPKSGYISIKNNQIVWSDLQINGENISKEPYTDWEHFGFLFGPIGSLFTVEELNQYYELVDYDACVNLTSMPEFCSSAGELINSNLSGGGDYWFKNYVIPSGAIKQIKEIPKDTIGTIFENDSDTIIIPFGTKKVDVVTNGTHLNKIILPSTVTDFELYGSYMNDIIVPEGVKSFKMGVTKIEKLILPSTVNYVELQDHNYNLVNLTIKNSKENVSIEAPNYSWKDGSECAAWTGDIKDNPCIHWEG